MFWTEQQPQHKHIFFKSSVANTTGTVSKCNDRNLNILNSFNRTFFWKNAFYLDVDLREKVSYILFQGFLKLTNVE